MMWNLLYSVFPPLMLNLIPFDTHISLQHVSPSSIGHWFLLIGHAHMPVISPHSKNISSLDSLSSSYILFLPLYRKSPERVATQFLFSHYLVNSNLLVMFISISSLRHPYHSQQWSQGAKSTPFFIFHHTSPYSGLHWYLSHFHPSHTVLTKPNSSSMLSPSDLQLAHCLAILFPCRYLLTYFRLLYNLLLKCLLVTCGKVPVSSQMISLHGQPASPWTRIPRDNHYRSRLLQLSPGSHSPSLCISNQSHRSDLFSVGENTRCVSWGGSLVHVESIALIVLHPLHILYHLPISDVCSFPKQMNVVS